MKEKKSFKVSKREIVIILVSVLVGALIMFLLPVKTLTELKGGNEIVATIKTKKFTSNDLYNELKGNGGVDALVKLIDDAILHDKYSLDKESKDYAKEQSEEIYKTYKQYYGYEKDEFLSSNGFDKESAFLDYLANQYYYQHYLDEYTEQYIDDKDISSYYDESVFGKKTIYIFSSTEDSSNLTKIAKMLKSGKKIKDIKKKYKKETSEKIEYSFKNASNYSEEFQKQVADTSKGKYTDIFTDQAFGNVLVYVESESKKPKFEDAKKDVVEVLVRKKQSEDTTLYYKAFEKLRKDYKLNIKDSELSKEYKESMKVTEQQ